MLDGPDPEWPWVVFRQAIFLIHHAIAWPCALLFVTSVNCLRACDGGRLVALIVLVTCAAFARVNSTDVCSRLTQWRVVACRSQSILNSDSTMAGNRMTWVGERAHRAPPVMMLLRKRACATWPIAICALDRVQRSGRSPKCWVGLPVVDRPDVAGLFDHGPVSHHRYKASDEICARVLSPRGCDRECYVVNERPTARAVYCWPPMTSAPPCSCHRDQLANNAPSLRTSLPEHLTSGINRWDAIAQALTSCKRCVVRFAQRCARHARISAGKLARTCDAAFTSTTA